MVFPVVSLKATNKGFPDKRQSQDWWQIGARIYLACRAKRGLSGSPWVTAHAAVGPALEGGFFVFDLYAKPPNFLGRLNLIHACER